MSDNERKSDQERMLSFLVQSVPRIEAPPFFAARVANLADVGRNSFAGSLQLFCRRLVPLFVTLMLVICFAAYQWRTPDLLDEAMLFYDEENLVENITIEDVVGSLALLPEEQNENH
ncbi:MAG: hypothetical protein ACWGQW_14335 [bacterium]